MFVLPKQRHLRNVIRSDDWNIEDKIRNRIWLLHLSDRDKEIKVHNLNLTVKSQSRLVKGLRKKIEAGRRKFRDADHGQTQSFKELCHAFDISTKTKPNLLTENYATINFRMRKEIDRKRYERRILRDKQVVLAKRYASITNTRPPELNHNIKRFKSVELKLKIATRKTETGVTLSILYKRILHKLKMEAIYQDSILEYLKKDCMVQLDSIVTAMEISQDTVDEVEAKMQRYLWLQDYIKYKTEIRKRAVADVLSVCLNMQRSTSLVEAQNTDLKTLYSAQGIKDSRSTIIMQIQSELYELDRLLNIMSDAMNANKVENLIKNIKKQKKRSFFVLHRLNMISEVYNDLDERRRHYLGMYSNLDNSYGQNKFYKYISKKKIMIENSRRHLKFHEEVQMELAEKNQIYFKITRDICSLLVTVLYVALLPEDDKEGTSLGASLDAESFNPMKVSYDVDFILDIIKDKLKVLLKAHERLNPNDYEVLQKPLKYREIKFADDHEILNKNAEDVASDYIDFENEDNTIPTYTSMKLQSSNIVISALVRGHRYLS